MDIIRNNPKGMTGLEQLRAMMASGIGPSIARTLEFRPIEVEEGRVVFEGTPGDKVLNPIGSVHGGYAATLLDTACGCAVHSKLGAGQGYTTLELKIAYHRALKPNMGPVRVEGVIQSFGRRVAWSEARLTDASGKLCVSATSTLLVFDVERADA